MTAFLNEDHHVNWIAAVGDSFLKHKGIRFDEYLDNLQNVAIPLDQLGILIYARMYHKHIAIVLSGNVWTTHKDNSLDHCELFLAYCGGVNFSDTCTGPDVAPLPSPPPELKMMEPTQKPLNLCKPGKKPPSSSKSKQVVPAKKPRKSMQRVVFKLPSCVYRAIC